MEPRSIVLRHPPVAECTKAYATAIVAPWHSRAQGACVPKWPSPPSQTVALFTRMALSAHTTGDTTLLYILPSLANDSPSIVYTTSTNGQTLSSLSSTPLSNDTLNLPGSWAGQNLSGPYKSSDLTGASNVAVGGVGQYNPSAVVIPNVQGRLVAVGVSITCTSPISDVGGTYYMYGDPLHANVATLNPSAIASQRNARVERITTGKINMTFCGIAEPEVEYMENTVYPYNTAPLTSVPALNVVSAKAAYASSTLTVTLAATAAHTAGEFVSWTDDNSNYLWATVTTTGSTSTTWVVTFVGGATSTNGNIAGFSTTVGPVANNKNFTFGGTPAFPKWNGLGGAIGVILINGKTGLKFEVEMISHVEYIGPSTSSLVHAHGTDQRGFERVQTIVQAASLDSSIASSDKAILAEAANDRKSSGDSSLWSSILSAASSIDPRQYAATIRDVGSAVYSVSQALNENPAARGRRRLSAITDGGYR